MVIILPRFNELYIINIYSLTNTYFNEWIYKHKIIQKGIEGVKTSELIKDTRDEGYSK